MPQQKKPDSDLPILKGSTIFEPCPLTQFLIGTTM